MEGSITLLFPPARRLQGKVALVTGGASGIGACTARLFCRHGAKVVIADIQDDKGLSLCNTLCEAIGADVATFVHCDITCEEDVRSAVDLSISKYGKLNVMFNNAGIIDGSSSCIVESAKTDFEHVIAVNLTGSFLGTKHAARVMIPAGGGSIILAASVCSVIGTLGSYAYTCSKHALVGLAKNAAVELGQHGVRVNCVSPYAVATPMTMERLGVKDEEAEELFSLSSVLKGVTLKMEDVAEAALYLASEESKYVSGHNLVVDGGFSITNAAAARLREAAASAKRSRGEGDRSLTPIAMSSVPTEDDQ